MAIYLLSKINVIKKIDTMKIVDENPNQFYDENYNNLVNDYINNFTFNDTIYNDYTNKEILNFKNHQKGMLSKIIINNKTNRKKVLSRIKIKRNTKIFNMQQISIFNFADNKNNIKKIKYYVHEPNYLERNDLKKLIYSYLRKENIIIGGFEYSINNNNLKITKGTFVMNDSIIHMIKDEIIDLSNISNSVNITDDDIYTCITYEKINNKFYISIKNKDDLNLENDIVICILNIKELYDIKINEELTQNYSNRYMINTIKNDYERILNDVLNKQNIIDDNILMINNKIKTLFKSYNFLTKMGNILNNDFDDAFNSIQSNHMYIDKLNELIKQNEIKNLFLNDKDSNIFEKQILSQNEVKVLVDKLFKKKNKTKCTSKKNTLEEGDTVLCTKYSFEDYDHNKIYNNIINMSYYSDNNVIKHLSTDLKYNKNIIENNKSELNPVIYNSTFFSKSLQKPLMNVYKHGSLSTKNNIYIFNGIDERFKTKTYNHNIQKYDYDFDAYSIIGKTPFPSEKTFVHGYDNDSKFTIIDGGINSNIYSFDTEMNITRVVSKQPNKIITGSMGNKNNFLINCHNKNSMYHEIYKYVNYDDLLVYKIYGMLSTDTINDNYSYFLNNIKNYSLYINNKQKNIYNIVDTVLNQNIIFKINPIQMIQDIKNGQNSKLNCEIFDQNINKKITKNVLFGGYIDDKTKQKNPFNISLSLINDILIPTHQGILDVPFYDDNGCGTNDYMIISGGIKNSKYTKLYTIDIPIKSLLKVINETNIKNIFDLKISDNSYDDISYEKIYFVD